MIYQITDIMKHLDCTVTKFCCILALWLVGSCEASSTSCNSSSFLLPPDQLALIWICGGKEAYLIDIVDIVSIVDIANIVDIVDIANIGHIVEIDDIGDLE